MVTETTAVKDKNALAEAKTEAKGEVPNLAVEVTEKDLPSRKDALLLLQEDNDPNEGWTNQAAENDNRTFVERDALPGHYVTQAELPTREGLADIGVVDPAAYLVNVPVRD